MQNISTYLSPPPYGSSPQLTGDPLLSGSTPKGKSLRLDGTLGGYPVKFLYHIVRLNKSLLVSHHYWAEVSPAVSVWTGGLSPATQHARFNGDETTLRSEVSLG